MKNEQALQLNFRIRLEKPFFACHVNTNFKNNFRDIRCFGIYSRHAAYTTRLFPGLLAGTEKESAALGAPVYFLQLGSHTFHLLFHPMESEEC